MLATLYSRLHEHPYETRSKSLREIETTTNLIKSLIPSRRSSASSVTYLGSFHKIPQLVTLEDSNDNFPEKVVQPKPCINANNEKLFKVTYICIHYINQIKFFFSFLFDKGI